MPDESEPAVVVEGDATTLLHAAPATMEESFDAVITDPPYSSGGTFRGDRTGATDTKYVCDHEVKNFHAPFSGDNRDQRAYGYWCSLWLAECLRLTVPGGTCCVFTDWRQIGTTIDAFQAGGWVYRGLVVWDKTRGARPTMGRFKAQAEFIVWGSKGPMPADRGVGCLDGVFTHAPFQGKHHIAGKPEKLMRNLVEICPPSGRVLDPFAGSGTTGVACVETSRQFLGIEREPAYVAIARRRIAAARATEASLFTGAAS